MTTNYTDPRVSPKDAVRFLIGDTTDPVSVRDEEILFLLDENGGNVYLAAADAADGLANSSAGEPASKSVGPLSVSYARGDEYRAMAKDLRRRAARFSAAMPYAGGISKSDKVANASSDDTRLFTIGGMDNPGTDLDDRLRDR